MLRPHCLRPGGDFGVNLPRKNAPSGPRAPSQTTDRPWRARHRPRQAGCPVSPSKAGNEAQHIGHQYVSDGKGSPQTLASRQRSQGQCLHYDTDSAIVPCASTFRSDAGRPYIAGGAHLSLTMSLCRDRGTDPGFPSATSAVQTFIKHFLLSRSLICWWCRPARSAVHTQKNSAILFSASLAQPAHKC